MVLSSFAKYFIAAYNKHYFHYVLFIIGMCYIRWIWSWENREYQIYTAVLMHNYFKRFLLGTAADFRGQHYFGSIW